MQLSQLTKILNGVLVGVDATVNTIVIDSRTVQPGDCFFAIKGEFFDGHDFIADVAKKNAAVVIIDRDIHAEIPVIRVKNTRAALMDLARFYRENTSIPVAAITGSCGKTTTRALLENILKQRGNVLASQKSFNNDIGLPLTLLKLNTSHDFVVLELGTNHPGEIAQLTFIAKPTIASVTMVASVHIEHFEGVDGIAREKGVIFSGLTDDGVAVINADDTYADTWKTMAAHRRIITFGQNNKSDVMARNVQSKADGQTTFTLVFPSDNAIISLPLLGEHNVTNALCAAAMAFAMHISMDAIKKGLETAQSEYGRLIEKKGLSGATILDDSYNANPASVKAAITLLTHRTKNSILVLGDMVELGSIAEAAHTDIGVFASQQGVKQLFCYGKNSALIAQAFGKNAYHFDDQQQLIDSLKNYLTPDTTVLVKGSRSMKMELVVRGLV